MPKVGDIFVNFFANTTPLRGGLAQASSLIRDWSLVVTGLTEGITNAFKVVASVGIKAISISLIALSTAFAITAKSGAEFQDNIIRAFVIMRESSGATSEALRALTKEAIRLGSETLFSATQAAIGLQTLARAGFSTKESIAAIGPVLDLAIVGNIELAEASNIAVASMFGFGLEASDMTKVVDVLSLASSQANTTISLLGSALAFVAPVALSAGLSIEETASAIGVLSNAGIRGSRAGTTLRRAFSILLAPTGRAKKIFDELGLSFNTAEGGLISFNRIIAKLNKASLTAAETQTIFGRIAGPGMAALLRQGSGALGELTEKLEKAEGAADRMSQAFRTTVKGRVRDLGASVINLGLAFSERFNKPLADTIFAIRNYVKVNTEALQKTKIFKAIVDGVINALSPLTEEIVKIAKAFQVWLKSLTSETVISFFEDVKVAVEGFVKKITDPQFHKNVTAFFKGIIIIVKGFIDAIISIGKAFEALPKTIQPLVASIAGLSTAFLTLAGGIGNIINFMIILTFIVIPLLSKLKVLVGGLFALSGAAKVAGFAMGTTAAVGSGFVAAMGAMAAAVLPVIGIIGGIVLAIATLMGAISFFKGEGFMKGFTGLFKAIGKGFKDIGGKIISTLGEGITGGLDAIKELIFGKNIFQDLEGQAKEAADKATEALKEITVPDIGISSVKDKVKEVATKVDKDSNLKEKVLKAGAATGLIGRKIITDEDMERLRQLTRQIENIKIPPTGFILSKALTTGVKGGFQEQYAARERLGAGAVTRIQQELAVGIKRGPTKTFQQEEAERLKKLQQDAINLGLKDVAQLDSSTAIIADESNTLIIDNNLKIIELLKSNAIARKELAERMKTNFELTGAEVDALKASNPQKTGADDEVTTSDLKNGL